MGRHLGAVGLTTALTVGLFWIGRDPDVLRGLPLSHAVLADVSLILLCLILGLGALGRLLPQLRPIVPWSRELGIGMFLTGGLHAMLLLGLGLEFSGLVGVGTAAGFEFGSDTWSVANWVGLLALGYALALAITSNDWSQRLLRRGWKFLHRQAYTLFVLVWIHAAIFVLLGAGHGTDMAVPAFVGVTGAAVVLQLAGFARTVAGSRGHTPSRLPRERSRAGSERSGAILRWAVAIGLWAVFVGGAWFAAGLPSEEDLQVALLCDTYDEMGRPVTSADVLDELALLIAGGWERLDVSEALADNCPRF